MSNFTTEQLQRFRAIVESGTPLARNTVLKLIEHADDSNTEPALVNTFEELDALPIGTVVYAANHIGTAERFQEGWFGCGNAAAWPSAVLARSGLPATIIHRSNP